MAFTQLLHRCCVWYKNDPGTVFCKIKLQNPFIPLILLSLFIYFIIYNFSGSFLHYPLMIAFYLRETFEQVVLMFNEYTKLIPLTFLLGFYVTSIVTRWWAQFELVAWPDDILSFTCLVISGSDSESKIKRHTIARYLLLTATLAWRDISVKVRKRFPTIDNIVKTGLMTKKELDMYDLIKVSQHLHLAIH